MPPPAASLRAEVAHARSLDETGGRNREQLAVGFDRQRGDHLITPLQVDPGDAARGRPRRPHHVLREADRAALAGNENDLTVAGRHERAAQPIFGGHAHHV